MSTAGFAVVLKLAKASVSGTALATTDDGSHEKYQITDTGKRILDPTQPITVYVDGVEADAGDYTVDTLFGVVTFADALTGSEDVTVDADYLSPVLPFAECHEFSMTDSLDLLDNTSFDTNGWKSKQPGLADAALEVSTFTPLLYDLDPGAATVTLFDLLTAREPFLVDVNFGTGPNFRGWFVATGIDEKISVGAVIDHPVKLAPVDIRHANGRQQTVFGWGTP